MSGESATTHCSCAALPVVTERCGVAVHRTLKFTALYKRVKVKLSTKFRVWPFAGDPVFMELDPSEWRKRYRVVEEFKTDQEQRVI